MLLTDRCKITSVGLENQRIRVVNAYLMDFAEL